MIFCITCVKGNRNFWTFVPTANVPTAIKIEGGGVEALMLLPKKSYYLVDIGG